MIEFAIVFLILAFFIFPLYTSAGCLGLFTTWFLFKNYESFKNQPLQGRKVLSSLRTAFIVNFLGSLILGWQFAWLISFFIYDYFYLFAFNFIFCFLISIRWFDFSRRYFQELIIGHFEKKTVANTFFVVCQGFKEASGSAEIPAFTDAGFLKLEEGQAIFDGTFFNINFSSKNIVQIEKKSSEKIKIYIRPIGNNQSHVFLISLRDQFYPFRSSGNRDKIIKSLSNHKENISELIETL